MRILILLLLSAFSFSLALLFTPLIRRFALHFGFVDRPDSQRKIHPSPVPRMGGVAILFAYIGSYVILTFVPGFKPLTGGVSLSTVWSLVPAALLVFLIGLADDVWGLTAWQKLSGELVASAIAVYSGVDIDGFSGFVFNPWIATAGTLLWLVGCTNALNLVDGVDGLAAGLALLAAMTTAVAAILNGDTGLALATVPLACALLGFLRYNTNPASIFLGDCGSLTVGFLLGCYGVLWCEKSATVLGMTAPLIALAVPLLDTAIAVLRRYLRRQPIFGADRSHIHHRLLARGLTHRQVVLLLYAAAGCASVLSLVMSRYHDKLGGIVLVLFAAGAIVGIQYLKYAEFHAVRRMLGNTGFRRHLNDQIYLDACEERLLAAGTTGECWSAIEATARNFGFHAVELQVAGLTFTYRDATRSSDLWQIRVPLSDSDFVVMSHSFARGPQPHVVEPFVDTLRRTLGAKVVVFYRERAQDSDSKALAATASN